MNETIKRYFLDTFYYKNKDEILEVSPNYKHEYKYFVMRKFYLNSLLDKVFNRCEYSVVDNIRHKTMKQFNNYVKRRLKRVNNCDTVPLRAKEKIRVMRDKIDIKLAIIIGHL